MSELGGRQDSKKADSKDQQAEETINSTVKAEEPVKEVGNPLAKKTSVEIACPLTSIMEDDDEYDRKSPGKSVEKVFQSLTT